MKKITLLLFVFAIFTWQSNAQYGCDSGVAITDGYTATGITSPGTGGAEDWNDPNPSMINMCTNSGGSALSGFYFDDDVYLFTYTAGVDDEEVSMTITSNTTWTGLGIFASCTGTALDDCMGSSGSSSGGTLTATANISGGQTVYIAVGQWGTPNALDFDVDSFTASPLVNPPNCDAALTSPANGETDANLNNGITWSAATGAPTGYKVTIGTTMGGNDVADNVDVGDNLTYAVAFSAATTYYTTITPYNSNGDATGCTEESFTTTSAPACPTLTTTLDACGNFDVEVTWDAVGNADSYSVTVGTTMGGNDVADNVDVGNNLNYTITNTTVSTDYYVTVNAVNSAGTSSGCTEAMYTTAAAACYCDSTPSSNDGNGIASLTVDATDFTSGGDITYEDFTGSPVDLPAGIVANVQIVFETGYTYDTNIWIDFNDDFNFSADELVFDGVSTADNPTTLDASFQMPVSAALGTHRMRIGTADSGQATPDPCYTGSYGVTMDVDVNIVMASCNAADATAAINDDCGNSQFYVDVDVTTVGDATQVNDGTNTYAISGAGIVQAGPYASGATVSLTVEHTDPTCDFSLGDFSYTCPPVNDDCSGAIDVTVDVGFCDGTNNNGDNTGATDSGLGLAACFNYGENDVWFSFTVPATTATVDISTDFLGGTNVDTEIALYSGVCGSLTEVACDNDGGTTILSNGSSWNSLITDQAVTAGETYYVRVSGYNAAREGTFCLELTTNQTLSIDDFERLGFTYFPNPVNNTLTINAQNAIDNVSILNMLGQEVLKAAPNSVNSVLDLSQLQTGAYFAKVTIGNSTETVRIIKQ
ncbi:T9SS type A sorting domain-containing protein [Psychroserpens sp. MEBiC05023]